MITLVVSCASDDIQISCIAFLVVRPGKRRASNPRIIETNGRANWKWLFFSFFINISLQPVLRLVVTIQKFFFNKERFFRTFWTVFIFCLAICFRSRGVELPPPMIGYMSPKNSSFFTPFLTHNNSKMTIWILKTFKGKSIYYN